MTLVGAHLGGVSVGWIVAPLLVAFVAYEGAFSQMQIEKWMPFLL